MIRTSCALGLAVSGLFVAPSVFAQTNATPPADVSAAVAAPTAPGAPPPPPPPATDATNASVSAGGQIATGNSKLAAFTANGKFDMRRGQNAFAAAVIGNYAEGFVTPGATAVPAQMYMGNTYPAHILPAGAGAWQETTENLQGKLRYDRYFTKSFSAFVQLTGLHDAFQALTFRLNVDPGVKLLFVNTPSFKFWGEAGYDFQYDDNYTNNGLEQSPNGNVNDALGGAYLISQSDTIHSGRLFTGFQLNFNKDVQLGMGLEYLQGFGGTGGAAPGAGVGQYTEAQEAASGALPSGDLLINPQPISLTGSRVNYDVLLSSKLGAGLSFGLGFLAKYNSAPLPGKTNLDTATTLTLIYSFTDSAAKPTEPPKTCPCPPENPPPPPPAAVVVVTPVSAPPPPPPPPATTPAPTPAPATPAPTH